MAKVVGLKFNVNGFPVVIKNAKELDAIIGRIDKSLANLGVKGIDDITKAANASKKAQKEANDTLTDANGILKQNVKNQGELKQALKETRKATDDTDFGTDKFRKLEVQQASLKNVQKGLRDGLRKTAQELEFKSVDPTSLRSVELQYIKLRNQVKLLSRAEQESEFGKNLIANAAKAKAEIRRVNDLLKDGRDNVGNYESAFNKLSGSFGQGFLGDIVGGIVSGGTVVAGELAIQALSEVGDYVKEVVAEFRELKKEVNQLTGATGDDLDQFTQRIKTISNVFGKDFTDVLQAANAEAAQTGITIPQALDAIQDRFLTAAGSSEDLLDSIKEYSPFINEAKLSADQFTAILANSAKQGIVSDKGIDAVKEAVLRIRELPKATEDAINKLGITSNQLEQIIAEEGIGGAIAEISEKINGLADDSPLIGEAVANIFGSAGEDAGVKYIKSLKNINDSTADLVDTSNGFVAAQIRQLEVQGRLNEAQSRLANIFGDGNVELDNLTNLIKAELTSALVDILESFLAIAQNAADVIEAFTGIKSEGSDLGFIIDILAKGIKIGLVGNIELAAKGLRILNSFFAETILTVNNAARAIANFDLDALREQFTGFFSRLGIRAGLTEEVEESEGVLSSFADRVSQASKKAIQGAIAEVETNKKRTDSLKETNKEQETSNKLIKEAETGLAFYEAEISRLNSELKSADTSEYLELSKILVESESKAKELREDLEAAKNSIIAANREPLVILAEIEAGGLPNSIEAPTASNPLEGEGEIRAELNARKEATKKFLESTKLDQLNQERQILNEKLFNSDVEFKERLRIADELAAKELEITRATEEIKREERRKTLEELGSILSGVQEGISVLSEIGEIRSQRQLNKVEETYQREIELAGENEEAKEAADEKYAKAKSKIDEKAFKRNQAFAITQALVNGALAATQALANTTLPFPISLTALIPIAIQTGLQVASIRSQKFKGEQGLYLSQDEAIHFGNHRSDYPGYMENGGTVTLGGFAKGRRHSQGGIHTRFHGIPVEIEDGEFVDVMEDGGIAVINRKSSQAFAPTLKANAGKIFNGKREMFSKINQRYGGVKFENGGAVNAFTPNLGALGRESLRGKGISLDVKVNSRISGKDMDMFAQKVAEENAAASYSATKEAAIEGAVEVNRDNNNNNLQ